MEYFIQANSFAAPMVSDTSTSYIDAISPREALERFAAKYTHPCGLYSANCYRNADALHKGKKPLAQWLCNQQIAIEKETKDLGSYRMGSDGPGKVNINDKSIEIKDPKGGRVV